MVEIDAEFEEEDVWTFERQTLLGTIIFVNFSFLDISRLDSTLTVFNFLENVGILIEGKACLFYEIKIGNF